MRAVIVTHHGEVPQLSEGHSPHAGQGQALLAMRAAAINPADVAITQGTFYAGSPPVPFVPGIEGVGVVQQAASVARGTRVYATGAGLGVAYDGSFAEYFVASEAALIPISDAVDDAVAVALGTAGLAGWLPLAWRCPVRSDDVVLVLGATGTAGSVAVQTAKLLGAKRVVAAGRRPEGLARASRCGADATVSLETEDLPAALRAACGEGGPTLVADFIWGAPLEHAVAVAARGARIVHIGQAAGGTISLSSAAVRGKQLNLLGYSNFAVPREVLVDAYLALLGHAVAGRLQVDLERFGLDDIAHAWQRQVSGVGVKIVLVP